jgi:DNA-binding CsgD family transcriptional regulator
MIESLIIRSGGITYQDGAVNLNFPSVTWHRADREPAEDTLGAVKRASKVLSDVFRIQSPRTDAYTMALRLGIRIEKIGFTPDEIKLLALHTLGNPDKQIAAIIGRNFYFVKNTLARARKRAATEDVTHTVIKAIRSGELPL